MRDLATLFLGAAPPDAHGNALDHDGWTTVQHRSARTQPWPIAKPLAHSGAHFDATGARSRAAGGGAVPSDAAQELDSKVVVCGLLYAAYDFLLVGSGPFR
jgi:hypothetical protein